jgi:hypothetical protein
MLEINLSAGFDAVGVLTLAGGLLHALVGNDVAGFAVGDGETQFVFF